MAEPPRPSDPPASRGGPARVWMAVLPDERPLVGGSFVGFFLLLTGYFALRPLRDEMGIAGGVQHLPWLFLATFAVTCVAVPVWSAVVARVPRRVLLPLAYRVFALLLLGFYVAFRVPELKVIAARAFFVWLSVFNLMAVSIFWSFMADLFRRDQAQRLFGLISAGGSAGAILGPLATSLLVARLGPDKLLLVGVVVLEAAAQTLGWVRRRHQRRPLAAGSVEGSAPDVDSAVGGGALSGVRQVFTSPYLALTALFVWLATTSGTFGYLVQANLMAGSSLDSVARTTLFARIDLATNALALILQAFVAAPFMARVGVPATLAILPPLSAAGFGAVVLMPGLLMSGAMQALRRGVGFGLGNPATHVLFTVVGPEERYKAKALIDTIAYRGGDALGAAAFGLLGTLGLGVVARSAIGIPVGLVWFLIALWLGRRYRRLADADRR